MFSEYSLKQLITEKLKKYRSKPSGTAQMWIGDGAGNIYPDKSNLNIIYVHDSHGIVEKVYNDKVMNIPQMQVFVGIDESRPRVKQIMDYVTGFGNTPYYPAIPPGISKVLSAWGVEPLYVYGEAILPWLVRPNATNPFAVDVYPAVGYSDGEMVIPSQSNFVTVDLTSHIPISGAWCPLIILNGDGTYTVVDPLGTADALTSLETINFGALPIGKQAVAWIRLFSGQSKIRQEQYYTDIFDPRWITSLSSLSLTGIVELIDAIPKHNHGITRWASSGGTTFGYPDTVESIENVTINGVLEDATYYTLIGNNLVFDSVTNAGDVIQSEYIPART